MLDFNILVTSRPDVIEQILISDLHLPLIEPVPNMLEQAFLALLDRCLTLPNLQKLYILGDWFEAWLGDDMAETAEIQAYLSPMLTKLSRLQQKKCQILVMVGNRDFLLGQGFCDKFEGLLIQQPYYFNLKSMTICLEHGDALCTDDKAYQRFRKVIQHPITKAILLTLPIKKRQQIAHRLRQKSRADTAIKYKQSMTIMDVNPLAVNTALQRCDILVHGHTHRPNVHQIGHKQRLVLGDWRVINQGVVAEIGVVIDGKLELVTFTAT